MFHRALLSMTMVFAALTLAVAPAFAGEDPAPAPAPAPVPAPAPTPTAPAPTATPLLGTAQLHSTSCIGHTRTKESVSGQNIASVTFSVDGKKRSTDSTADASGAFTYSMSCSRLSFGSHRGTAAVTFTSGATPSTRTLSFRVTRIQTARPQFAG